MGSVPLSLIIFEDESEWNGWRKSYGEMVEIVARHDNSVLPIPHGNSVSGFGRSIEPCV